MDCPARGRCPDEPHSERCIVFRMNCKRGRDLSRYTANERERSARRKDEQEPIPEAEYMQQAEQAAKSMPGWLASAYLASRREAYGIREL